MHPALVSQDDLLKLADLERAAGLERWLIEQGIAYKRLPGRKRKIFTTVDAVNRALFNDRPDASGYDPA